MSDRERSLPTRTTAGLVGLVVVLAAVASVATLVGTTTVSLSPADGSVDAGETTHVDVVVGDVDGGVGALNLTVRVADPSRATIESVDIHGDPGVHKLWHADDGSAVTMSAALADTADAGEVTIATVVLRGEHPGTTVLDVAVETLGNEDGAAYAVSGTQGAMLKVTPAHDPTTYSAPDDEDDAPTTTGPDGNDPVTTAGDDPAGSDGTTVAGGADPPSDDAPTTSGPAEDPQESTSLSLSSSVLPWAVLFGAVLVALALVAYRRR